MAEDRISAANALGRDAFRTSHVDPALARFRTSITSTLSFETSATISATDLNACYTLLYNGTAAAYKASSDGWSSKEKKKEMRHLDMKYLLLHPVDGPSAEGTVEANPARMSNQAESATPGRSLLGFLSFMVTREINREDSFEIVYCYEVHVQPGLQGHGIGTGLMQLLEDIGRSVGVAKAMLTVFTSNQAGMRFYKRHGYEWYDEEPTPPKKQLRSAVKDILPSYVILIKDINS